MLSTHSKTGLSSARYEVQLHRHWHRSPRPRRAAEGIKNAWKIYVPFMGLYGETPRNTYANAHKRGDVSRAWGSNILWHDACWVSGQVLVYLQCVCVYMFVAKSLQL